MKMALLLTLLGGLFQPNLIATKPITPDFAALVPTAPPKPLTTVQSLAEWEAQIAEAQSLAGYLQKLWGPLTDGTASAELTSNALLVTSQLDITLNILNPEPTVTEAVKRIRAYREVTNAVLRNIGHAETNKLPPPATKVQVNKTLRLIYQRYQPLFSRVV